MRKLLMAALTVALVILPVHAAFAGETTDEPHKVYVCKYVGTPGVDETLQTGQNPIEVDTHALKDFPAFPATFPVNFNDAQDNSIAIGYVGEGYPVLTIENCPGYVPPVVHEPSITGEASCLTPETSTYAVDYTINDDGAKGIVSGTEPQDSNTLVAADFPLTGGSVTYEYSDGPNQTATYDAIALPEGRCAPSGEGLHRYRVLAGMPRYRGDIFKAEAGLVCEFTKDTFHGVGTWEIVCPGQPQFTGEWHNGKPPFRMTTYLRLKDLTTGEVTVYTGHRK